MLKWQSNWKARALTGLLIFGAGLVIAADAPPVVIVTNVFREHGGANGQASEEMCLAGLGDRVVVEATNLR
jgi:hypothetical protein